MIIDIIVMNKLVFVFEVCVPVDTVKVMQAGQLAY